MLRFAPTTAHYVVRNIDRYLSGTERVVVWGHPGVWLPNAESCEPLLKISQPFRRALAPHREEAEDHDARRRDEVGREEMRGSGGGSPWPVARGATCLSSRTAMSELPSLSQLRERWLMPSEPMTHRTRRGVDQSDPEDSEE